MRTATIERETKETKVSVYLDLDGRGECDASTGCGFLDHMLTLFAGHGRFTLKVRCDGDVDVDFHHSVEDIGICLGAAFDQALSDRRGITRYGSFLLPMDEALILCALDISGRGMYAGTLTIPTQKVGSFDTELVEEFMVAFCRKMGLTLHFQQFAGTNSHHIIEAAFKALGRALKAAVAVDAQYAQEIPSTKGVL